MKAKVIELAPAAKKPLKPKGGINWILAVGVLALILVSWFAWTKFRPANSGMGQIVSGTVKRGDLVETITATGSIAARTGAQVKIGSQITGRIKRLYADVGTEVKAGELIAELDLPEIQAQLDQSNANHASAVSKLAQQEKSLSLGSMQTQNSVASAKLSLLGAQQRLLASRATSNLQDVSTPAEIRRSEAVLKQASATLSTAVSGLNQVQAGVQLQTQTATENLVRAEAVDANNQAILVRQLALVAKGYIAQNLVDQAQQAATVSKSQVLSARHSLDLVNQKNTADLQAANDGVSLAQQGVETARSGLQVAQGGKYSTASREADVADAEASVRIAQTNIQLSVGNLTSNAVRAQDVAQAREAVAQTAAQVVASSAQVQKTFIRTPISGTVLQLATQQGETLAAGLSAPTLIIVADLKRLEVDAYVDETDIGKVQNGQTATVTVDAYPNQVMTAKVVKVASGSTIQQGVVTYGVTLYLDPNKLILKPDMTASVTIVTGKRTAVLIVPSVAIQVSLSGNGLRVLNTKNGKQTISLVKVVVGGTDGVNTEIVSGVAEGQAIVLAGGQPTKSPPANSAFGGGGGNRGSGGGGGGRPGG